MMPRIQAKKASYLKAPSQLIQFASNDTLHKHAEYYVYDAKNTLGNTRSIRDHSKTTRNNKNTTSSGK
jgi:hypothetical protein